MKKILILLLVSMFLKQGILIYGDEFSETEIYLKKIVVKGIDDEQGEKIAINSKTLKTHKVVDLAEILSDEMITANMVRKGGYGNEVVLRGFGQANLRFLADNTIIDGACGSRKDPPLSHIGLLTVDRIELREGPFDVTKPGALGGSINVVTKRPQQGFHGEILPKVGSFGYLSGGGYLTGGNKYIQGLVGYNYAESDQYKDGESNKLYSFAPSSRPYNADGRDMKSFKKHDLWGKIQFTPKDHHTFLLSHTYGYAEDVMAPRVGMDMESEETNLTRAEYFVTDMGSFSDKLILSLYRNEIEHNPFDKYRELVSDPLFHRRNDVDSIIIGGKIENKQLTDTAAITYGVDIYYRNWKGDMYNDDTGAIFDDELIPDVDTYDFGVYIKGSTNFEKWSLEGGLRYDWFQTEAGEDLKQSNDPISGITTTNKNTDNLLSGYFSARYHLTEGYHIFGGVGHSIRTPTSVERYLQSPSPYFHGNPDLNPTKNTEIDLGFQMMSEGFSITTKGFYSNLRDYIYQQGKMTADSHETWTNIDAHIYGADATVVVDIMFNFSIEAAAAYQRGRKETQPDENNDKDLAQIPPLKTRLALHYDNFNLFRKDSNLFGTLEWIHSEDAEDVDTDAGEKKLNGWDVLNFRAGYRYIKFTFNIGVDNIFDKHYAVANSYEWDVVSGAGAAPAIVNEPGRFIYGSVSYSF